MPNNSLYSDTLFGHRDLGTLNTRVRAEIGRCITMLKGPSGKTMAGHRTFELSDGYVLEAWVNPFGLAPIIKAVLHSPESGAVPIVLPLMEHGILDWDRYPPVDGNTSDRTEELILESQGQGRCVTHQFAGTMARSASVRQFQAQAPASSWTGLMQSAVQGLYGSGRDDYTTSAGPACVLTYENSPTNDWPSVSLGCWWGSTSGLMLMPELRFVYLIVGADAVRVIPGVLSAAGECHRLWLIDVWIYIPADKREAEVIALMGQLSPGPDDATVTVGDALDDIAGTTLSYGWHWAPTVVNPLGGGSATAKVVTLEFGTYGMKSKTRTLTVTGTWGGDYEVEVTTETHHSGAAIHGSVSIMTLDSMGMAGRVGTNPGQGEIAASAVPICGSYHGDEWITEKYTGEEGGTSGQVVTMTRYYCDGNISGESTRLTHVWYGKGTLSSAGGVGQLGTATTASPTSPAPAGTLALAGQVVDDLTGTYGPPNYGWGSGWIPDDGCPDWPDWPECGYTFRRRILSETTGHYVVTPALVGGSLSTRLWIVPCVGDPSVWYVGTVASRVTTSATTVTHLHRIDSRRWIGEATARGGTEPCETKEYDVKVGPSAGTFHTDFTEVLPAASTLVSVAVSRVAPAHAGNVWSASGTSNPVSGGEGSIGPDTDGLPLVDLSSGLPTGAWMAYAAAQYGIDYTPPTGRVVAVECVDGATAASGGGDGLGAWEKEPGEGLQWPNEYVIGYTPEHTDWNFVGRPGAPEK